MYVCMQMYKISVTVTVRDTHNVFKYQSVSLVSQASLSVCMVCIYLHRKDRECVHDVMCVRQTSTYTTATEPTLFYSYYYYYNIIL
jgi:hypothetical protein